MGALIKVTISNTFTKKQMGLLTYFGIFMFLKQVRCYNCKALSDLADFPRGWMRTTALTWMFLSSPRQGELDWGGALPGGRTLLSLPPHLWGVLQQ